MPYQTEDYIHLPKPDHPESDFRLNNKGEINIVGTTNYGAGVQGRLGLLKGSGNSAVYVYIFKKDKFTLETAQEWLDKHKGGNKAMDNDILTDKKFKFNMPLTKSYTDENDGYLYLEYALATTDVDLENEQLTSKCLKSMAKQATGINMYMDHKYTDETTLGPVIESKILNNQLWIKGRVRKSKTDTVNDILDAGTYMGGSFGGICQKDFMENGKRMLDEVKLLDATFTPMPVNTATTGTAKTTLKDCTVCNQIFKSIKHKYGLELTSKAKKGESYESIRDTITTALRSKYENGIDRVSIYVKLTFPDSVIVNWYQEGDSKLYEIPYSIDDAGEVTLGDPVEVEEQYVTKKIEVFKIKSNDGEDIMDEKTVQKMIEDNNKTLLDGVKALITPEEPKKEPENLEVKQIDEDKLADNVTEKVLKALGIETEEPEKEPESGIMVLTKSALEDLQSDAVQKALLAIGNQRQGERKSKSVGGSKFEIPKTEPTNTKTEKETGKLSTTKSAEALLIKKGVLPAA